MVPAIVLVAPVGGAVGAVGVAVVVVGGASARLQVGTEVGLAASVVVLASLDAHAAVVVRNLRVTVVVEARAEVQA